MMKILLKVLDAIHELLTHPKQDLREEQEPVAWMYDWNTKGDKLYGNSYYDRVSSDEMAIKRCACDNIRPLYTTPPKPEHTEQEPVFNFDLERMKLAVESPVSDVTVYEIRELLAQPEQEPIGEIALSGNTTSIGAPFPAVKWITGVMPAIGTKLYTAPQKREPLSDERLRDISNSINATYDFGNISVWQAFYIARLIEKEHDIGGEE